jgi:predicted phosphate transport protein (TIGR00153 family)
MLRLFGQDPTFYNLLEAQAEAAQRAAQAFHTMAQDFAHLSEHAQAIKQIEHEADELTHQLSNKVDSTFVTPLDKEDLHALSSGLDDITDAIESAAARITLYQITAPRPDLVPLVALLVQIVIATRETVSALRHARGRESLDGAFIRVHEFENQGDAAYRQALAALFNAPNPDPLMVLKWKEVYDRIEIATDACERVADIVESVVVKYA